MSRVHPVAIGPVTRRRRPPARPDRRAVRHRERGARRRPGRAPSGTSPRRRGVPVHLQGVVRQGQPDVDRARTAGPGLAEGLRVLGRGQGATSACPILTDIHEPAQAAPAAEVADVLQIPAFLCRQTDLLLAAAATGRAVNIKKGQFLAPARHAPRGREGRPAPATSGSSSPSAARPSATTTSSSTCARSRCCASFGYPVIFDVTHSLQLPGRRRRRHRGPGASTSSRWRSAGVAAGVDGVFLEVHEDPSRAKSDAQNALRARPARRAARPPDADRRGREDAAVTADRSEVPWLRPTRRPNSNSPARCSASRPTRSSASSIASTRAFTAAVDLLFDCRGRVIVTGMGKSGIIGRKIAATLSSTGHAGVLPPPGRGHPRRPRRRSRPTTSSSRCRTPARRARLLRLLETIRRIGAHADRDHRRLRTPRSARPPTSRSTAAWTRRPAR